MTIFISSDTIHQFAKVQSANSYVERDEVVLLWDELSRKQKNLAKNIDIDMKVQTAEPSTVPDKWSDKVEQVGDVIDTTDIIKMVIANPARHEVYDLLREEEPPEPLVLWWLDKTFSDPEYFDLLSRICNYGLFRGDTKYLWAVIAFGVEAGVGRFSWPESDSDSRQEKNIKKKIMSETGVREKELDLAWPRLREELAQSVELTEKQADELGIEVTEEDEEDEAPQSSLLDL